MMRDALPIMRPKLPSASAVVPYLSGIDSARVYSNFGPLATQLEIRLAAHFGVASTALTMAANATLGLALALSAQRVRPGTLCVIPAWTFVASPQAAILAGLVPYFVDVDPRTWALEPDAIDAAIARAPGEVGAVMPVAPFGRPIDVGGWDRFRSRTRLAVVIDAAAGFDTVAPTSTPAVVSLHATKVLGTGEGGFILCDDADLILGIRTRMNFGFHGSREALVPAFNAKLSEYHAAVGHAALDEWPDARAEWLRVSTRYREALAHSSVARLQDGFGDAWVSSVCVLELTGTDADRLERHMTSMAIETRRWWGKGAHAHPSMSACPRAPLPITEELARSTLAVPISRDLPTADVDRVIECVETMPVAG
jgi:dTDP-4-amino-4,6-dideoxygalactose transaminase